MLRVITLVIGGCISEQYCGKYMSNRACGVSLLPYGECMIVESPDSPNPDGRRTFNVPLVYRMGGLGSIIFVESPSPYPYLVQFRSASGYVHIHQDCPDFEAVICVLRRHGPLSCASSSLLYGGNGNNICTLYVNPITQEITNTHAIISALLVSHNPICLLDESVSLASNILTTALVDNRTCSPAQLNKCRQLHAESWMCIFGQARSVAMLVPLGSLCKAMRLPCPHSPLR